MLTEDRYLRRRCWNDSGPPCELVLPQFASLTKALAINQTLRDRLNHLRAIDRTSDGWVKSFEDALAAIAELESKDSIVPLLLCLDDNTAYDEAMFSIVHTVERFDLSTYVSAFTLALPEITARSPRWSSILMMRLLNSPKASAILNDRLQSVNADSQNAGKRLLAEINKVTEDFRSKTAQIELH